MVKSNGIKTLLAIDVLLITGMFVRLPLLADNQAPNQIGDGATHASFEPTWDSLSQYSCPEWFRDAKLGIFVCWNLHSLQGVDDWYYNQNKQWHGGRLEAVMNVKKWPVAKNHGPFSADMCVRDMEKGLLGGIEEYPWQNDTTVSSWFYQPTKPVRSVNSVVDMLIDIVAKNGNLLLNVPPRPDGTLDEAHKTHLVELGQWMKVNGEAIYATRPWKQYGEGPTTVAEGHFGDNKLGLTAKDLRFTRSKDGQIVYAILMDWPGGGAMADIKALAGTDAAEIKQVTLLGHDGPLKWTRDKEGLHVRMPTEKPCEHAFSLRVEFMKETDDVM